MLQLLDNKKMDISFLKESTFVEVEDIILSPIKLNITIAFVSVAHILTVEYMLTHIIS